MYWNFTDSIVRPSLPSWIVTLDVLKSVSGVPKSGVKAVE